MGKKKKTVVACTEPEHEKMSWYLDGDGVLFLNGEGRVPAAEAFAGAAAPPWAEQKDQIRCVRVSDGITELGPNAFAGCENLVKVVLPEGFKRFHYGCFSRCSALKEVIVQEDAEFRFVYEKMYEEEPEETEEVPENPAPVIMFGINSFYGTPWALERWGKFYIKNGVLLACFTTETEVKVPPEVHTVGAFAFKDSAMTDIELVDGFLKVGDMAFVDTKLTRVRLPETIQVVGDHAFSGSTVKSVFIPYMAEAEVSDTAYKDCGIPPLKRTKFDPADGYSLVLKSAGKGMEGFKQLKIQRKRGEDQSDSLRGGDSIIRRIKKQAVVIGILIDEELKMVKSVTSYSWNGSANMPAEYVVYPDQNGIVYDTCELVEEHYVVSEFFVKAVSQEIKHSSDIRATEYGTREEWFWTNEPEGDDKCMELKLLEQWLKVHPEYHVVESFSENGGVL